jgi:hypothetical protein
MLAGSEPGAVLGVFLIAGTVAAALAVRPGAVFLLIPVPALVYVVASVAAGLIHDQATDTSLKMLAISGVQWFAGGFIPMAAATAAMIVIAIARGLGQMRGPHSPGSPLPAREAARPRPQAARSPSARRGPGRDADYLADTARRPARPRRLQD